MVFYTEFILSFSNKSDKFYTCDRDGFENYAVQNINKLVMALSLYSDYVTDMLKFLNIDRGDGETPWPKWYGYDTVCFAGDNVFLIHVSDKAITVNKKIHHKFNDQTRLKIDNFTQFHKFLTKRFLLDKIWKLCNIPKDLSIHIETNYF